jgi:hypothetical protein
MTSQVIRHSARFQNFILHTFQAASALSNQLVDAQNITRKVIHLSIE